MSQKVGQSLPLQSDTGEARIHRKSARHRQERRFGLLLVAPACVYIIGINIFPAAFTVIFSFMKWNLANSRVSPRFVLLKNYSDLILHEPAIVKTILNTLFFVVGTVSLQVVAGVAIALLLNQNLKGTRIATSLLLIPMTIAPAVVAWLFSVLLNETLGPVNYLIGVVGFSGPGWLSDQKWALLSIILVDAWQWTPFVVIMTLAALRSQPASIFEAAKLDGAEAWQRFRFITLPLLRPVLAVIVLLRTIDAFKMFDLVFLLTGGGPGTASQTLSLYNYRLGIVQFDVGRSAALSVIMLAIALLFAVRFYRIAGTTT